MDLPTLQSNASLSETHALYLSTKAGGTIDLGLIEPGRILTQSQPPEDPMPKPKILPS